MEVNHLKYFYAVARAESFTKGSTLLRVSQPSVSKLVKNLEEELGFSLFERSGRKIRLTEKGSAVYRHCQVIFGEIEKIDVLAHRDAGRKQQVIAGTLRIGGAEAIVSHLIPLVLTSFHARFPQVYPSVIASTANDISRRIADGALDFGLFLHLPDLPDDLEVRQEFEIPHRIVVATQHRRSKAVLSRFIGSREVEVSGTKSFPSLSLLRKEIPDAAIAISTNSMTAQLKLVLSGVGVAVMPLFVCESEIKRGRLRCLFGPISWSLSVVTRKAQQTLSPAAQEFLAELARRAGS